MLKTKDVQILIADDSRSSRFILSRMLGRWGYSTVEASNGKEALAILQGKTPPRIALLDWMMPEMDGVDICRFLRDRQSGPLVYCILVTSKSEEKDRVKGLDSGAHDFLSKPVSPNELRSRLAVGVRLIKAEDKLLNSMIEMAEMAEDRECLIDQLRDALKNIKRLKGLLPICMHCKQIRNDKGFWDTVEAYIAEHSEAEFTHGLCPKCAKEHYPELDLENSPFNPLNYTDGSKIPPVGLLLGEQNMLPEDK